MNTLKPFFVGLSLDFFSRVVFVASGFAVNVFIARFYGKAIFGEITVLLSFLTVLTVILTNGIPNALSRYLSDESFNRASAIKSAAALQSLFAAGVILISWLSISVFSTQLNLVTAKAYFYILLLILPLNALFYLKIGIYNGQRDFKSQCFMNIVYPLTRMSLIFVLLFVMREKISAVMLATAISYLPAIAIGKSVFKSNAATKTVANRVLLFFGLKVMALFALITLFLNIDIIAYNSLESNPLLVGVYGAMATVGRITYFLLYSFSSTIFPLVSNLKAEGKPQKLSELVHRAFSFYFFIGVFIFACAVFYSDIIISLIYGTDYHLASINLSTYVLSMILLSLNSFSAQILLTINRKFSYLSIIFAFLVLEVFLIKFLFPTYGIAAGPFAMAGAQTASFLLLVFLLYKQNANAFPKSVAMFFIASVFLFIASDHCMRIFSIAAVVRHLIGVIPLLVCILISLKFFFNGVKKRITT